MLHAVEKEAVHHATTALIYIINMIPNFIREGNMTVNSLSGPLSLNCLTALLKFISFLMYRDKTTASASSSSSMSLRVGSLVNVVLKHYTSELSRAQLLFPLVENFVLSFVYCDMISQTQDMVKVFVFLIRLDCGAFVKMVSSISSDVSLSVPEFYSNFYNTSPNSRELLKGCGASFAGADLPRPSVLTLLLARWCDIQADIQGDYSSKLSLYGLMRLVMLKNDEVLHAIVRGEEYVSPASFVFFLFVDIFYRENRRKTRSESMKAPDVYQSITFCNRGLTGVKMPVLCFSSGQACD
jgi:hypothetical protein